MRYTLVLPLAVSLLALAACDQSKPRDAAPPPAAAAPGDAAPAAAPAAPMSNGLTRLAVPAGAYIDQIGKAINPQSTQPAVTPAAEPIMIIGFAYDPVANVPARGVDVVIDGVAQPATYGVPRPDVATYFKNPKLDAVGYNLTLPPGAVPAGDHKFLLRVVAADGSGFYETPEIAFTVR